LEATLQILRIFFLPLVVLFGVLSVAIARVLSASVDWINERNGLMTVVATFAIAWLTWSIVILTRQQAADTEAIQRAFLYPSHPNITRIMENGKIKTIRVDVPWENSGTTTARGAEPRPMSYLPERWLPDEYDFPQNYDMTTERMTISAKTKYHSWAAEISPDDFDAVVAGRKYWYIWGSIRYRDVFPMTNAHVTEYCFVLTRIESEGARDLTGDVVGEWHTCLYHNCSDEDCPDYKEQIEGYRPAVIRPPSIYTFPIPGLK
jgi:hypothetical protein